MRALAIFLSLSLLGCGARSGLDLGDLPDGGRRDAATGPRDAGPDARPPRRDGAIACVPVDDACEPTERCGDGSDNDCNGLVDEGCDCEPGEVQPCFAGPPGRRHVGACQDGAQVCGAGRRFGACEGAVEV